MSLQNPNLAPIVNAPSLYCNGLGLSWLSNTTIQVAAGVCRDESNEFDLSIASAITINAAVNGINGLDTGSLAASKAYAVYVMADASNILIPGCLISLSATQPVVPAGYNLARRIGWVVTDGSSHFLNFIQSGGINNSNVRSYQYDAQFSVLSGGNATSFTAVDLSAIVPYVGAPVIINSVFTPATAAHTFSLRPTGSSVAAANAPWLASGVVAAVAQSFPPAKLICGVGSSKPEIDYVVANGSDALTLLVAGYDDYI